MWRGVKFVPPFGSLGLSPIQALESESILMLSHQLDLSEEDRWRIHFLRHDLKLTEKDIAEQIPTTQKAISLILKKYQETGTVHTQAGQGR